MEILINFIYFFNELIDKYYYFVLITYFISLVFFYSGSLPGSPIPSIASGFFFGFYVGFLVNIFSILLGSFIFVFIAKFLFSKLFEKYFVIFSKKINSLLKDSSFEYLVLLRLILGNPLFVQNLCLSFTNISKTKFFASSFIGLSPLMLLFTYTGSKISNLIYIEDFSLSDILSLHYILLLIALVLFLVLTIILKKIYFKNK